MKGAPEPQYVRDVRARNGQDTTRLAIERAILRGWRHEWSRPGGKSPTGHTFTGHLIVYTIHAFPNLDMNPWLRRMLSSFEFTYFKQGRKICNLIGSQNSGKTDFFATAAMIFLSIDPEFTAVYAASPYLGAAESGMWGRIRKRNADGAKAGIRYRDVESKEKIIAVDGLAEAGFIQLRSIDKVGKLQGKKQPDNTGLRGWLILFCDEIEEFPTQALKDLLDNLQGNVRFFCYTGCNFKDVNGLAGALCKPEGMEFSALDPDTHFRWISERRSVTYRFDGHRSPNIVAGKVIYTYLFKEEDRQRLEEVHGLTGPKYLEQARSFPFSQMAEFLVTTSDEIKAFGGWEEPVWSGPVTRVAFCDAAFGGKDPCVFGIYEFGLARCEDSEGKWHNRQVFRPVVPHMTIKLDVIKALDKDWAERVAALSKDGRHKFQQLGTRVSVDQQVAVACGELLREWNIPFENFGFDGSMRAEFTQEMITVLGNSVIALDFGGTGTDRPAGVAEQGNPGEEPKVCRDVYATFVTEMYFAVGTLVRAGQFRGAKTIPQAIRQLTKRWWKWRGKRKTLQPKDGMGKADTQLALKSYKQEHGESPDHADTLVGAIEIMRRKGLWPEASRSQSVTDAQADKGGSGSALSIAVRLNQLLAPKIPRLSKTL